MDPAAAAVSDAPPVLSRRLAASPHPADLNAAAATHTLSLPAAERSRLRGRRTTDQGLVVLLQLQRSGPLQAGEWLCCERLSLLVRVEAAREKLLAVEAPTPVALLQAAYHLGNRHLPLQIQGRQLLLPDDKVLAQLLRDRGLSVRAIHDVFQPEPGAHAHGDGHGSP